MYFKLSQKIRQFYAYLREPSLSLTWYSWLWTVSAGTFIGTTIYIFFNDKSTLAYALCGFIISGSTLLPALKKGMTIGKTEVAHRECLLDTLEHIDKKLANIEKNTYLTGTED